jgi:hypothetical protein
MKLANQEVLPEVDPRLLTARANSHFETLAFLQEHPEYVRCQHNQDALMAELGKRAKDTPPTFAELETAYRALVAKGTTPKPVYEEIDLGGGKKKKRLVSHKLPALLTRETVEDLLRVGTDKDVNRIYQENGIERRDHRGKVVGYDLPESFKNPSAEEMNTWGRGRTTSALRPISETETTGYKPTKREFAQWSADKQRAWMEDNGYWGGDLPRYLR